MAGRKITCVEGSQVHPRLTEAFLSSRVQVRGRDRHPTCRSIRAVGSFISTPLSPIKCELPLASGFLSEVDLFSWMFLSVVSLISGN